MRLRLVLQVEAEGSKEGIPEYVAEQAKRQGRWRVEELRGLEAAKSQSGRHLRRIQGRDLPEQDGARRISRFRSG